MYTRKLTFLVIYIIYIYIYNLLFNILWGLPFNSRKSLGIGTILALIKQIVAHGASCTLKLKHNKLKDTNQEHTFKKLHSLDK